MIIDQLNKDLKNVLGEIKKLTCQSEELKNELNKRLKDDSNRLASSENEFRQVINRKQNRQQYCRGGTVLPREPQNHSRQVQNEPFFSENKYITSTESKETEAKVNRRSTTDQLRKWLYWVTLY